MRIERNLIESLGPREAHLPPLHPNFITVNSQRNPQHFKTEEWDSSRARSDEQGDCAHSSIDQVGMAYTGSG